MKTFCIPGTLILPDATPVNRIGKSAHKITLKKSQNTLKPHSEDGTKETE